jgi:hypothetical protein
MAQFEFKVNIEANDNEEAKRKLASAIKIMKAACAQVGVNEFENMCNKIEKSPGKIKLAKNFI